MRLNDKGDLNRLRDRINEALAPLVAELGLTKLRAGNIKYDELTATIQVKAEAVSPDGQTNDALEYERYCSLFDLKPEWINRTFRSNGEQYELVGLKPSRRKYPVIGARLTDGKRMLFVAEDVRRQLEKTP